MTLIARLWEASGRTGIAPETVEPLISKCIEDAKAAWPGVGISAEAFASYLGERLGADVELDDALIRTHVRELYLACACGLGDRVAGAALERTYFASGLRRVLSRVAPSADQQDEVRQLLRVKLLGDGRDLPKIRDYSGVGELQGWINVAAVRIALNQQRGAAREEVGDEVLDVMPASGHDPELAALKTRYREDFKTALSDAFCALSPRDRNFLRQHYVDGVNIQGLAALYGAHRVTASRWLEDARAALLSGLRALLIARLGVDGQELDSILALVHTQLDVSLRVLLKTAPPRV